MLTAERLLASAVLLKAVEVVLRGPSRPLWWALALLLLATGAALVLRQRSQAGWALVLAGCAATAADLPLDLRRQHLALFALVAVVMLVARGDAERLLLVRVQVSALYGVAALAKLNESYLGGDVLAGTIKEAPVAAALLPEPTPVLVVALGAGLVALEALLAVSPWVARLRVPALVLGAAFHIVAVPLAGTDPLVALRLAVFGGTSAVLLAVSAVALQRRSAEHVT